MAERYGLTVTISRAMTNGAARGCWLTLVNPAGDWPDIEGLMRAFVCYMGDDTIFGDTSTGMDGCNPERQGTIESFALELLRLSMNTALS